MWLNATELETGTSRQLRPLLPALPAVTAGLMGLGTLIGYAAGSVPDPTHPGWMPPATALSFILFAFAVVLFRSETRAVQRIAEAALLLMIWISALAIVGYLYNARSLYTFKPYVSIALPTALAFVFIGVALLYVRPDRGVMAILLSQETGGLMLRRIVPLTLGMVILIGWVRLAGELTGTFGHTFSLTVVVGLSMAGFGFVLWMVARYLNGVEKQWSESRIRLQLAKEAADLGIHDYDVVHGRIQWDERVRRLWGVRSEEPITIETFWAGVYPEDRASTKAAMDRALDPNGGGRYAAEFRVVHRTDGETRWIEARGRTIFERGRAVRLVGTVEDITERKQGEAALREAHERLRRWNEDLEQAVNVKTAELIQSQERLRALASELSLTEQRERTRLATELHDHLQQMLVLGKLEIGQGKRFAVGSPACERVMKRVDDILSDSLTYSRTLVAELSPPVLRDHGLAAGLKWLAEYMKKRHEQTVTVSVPEEDLKLPEDQRILLFQSVRELLINASKYAGTGEAAVEMIQSENQVRIEVRDQGAGFDLTVDAAAVGTPSGGISSKFGLFSIRERMRALGGSCVIESAPGQGTKATLVLPVEGGEERVVSGEEGDHDGQELPRSQSVAGGDQVSGGVLPRDKRVSARGTIRPDQSNPSRGNIGGGQYRRRSGETVYEGVLESSEHRTGIADGAGDASIAQSTSRPAEARSAHPAPGHVGRSQSNAIGTPPRTQDAQVTGHASLSTRHSPRSPIRVLLVDDHAMVRQGLRSVLDAYDDVQVVGEAQDGSEAVRLAGELRPRVVVMDINMPTMGGIEATERIKTQWPGTVVIGISVNTGDASGQAMKQAGAVGLITKDAAVDELYAVIRRETADAAEFETSERTR